MRIGVFFIGLLFGFALLLSGMTNPIKVQGFLDVFGAWDATLVFVLGGAVVVSFIGFQCIFRKRAKPLQAETFHAPSATRIDKRLMMGSVIFGIGWGIAGICPGPALVLLGAGVAKIAVFVVAMLIGMLAWQVIAASK